MGLELRKHSQPSLIEAGAARLMALIEATGMERQSDAIFDVFNRALGAWGREAIRAKPLWPSEVGDDHSPYEFSVAYGTATELRLLVEPLGSPPSLTSNRDEGLRVIADLAKDLPISTRRLDLIRDLFLPDAPQGLFSLWLGISFWRDRAAQLKIYLNPEAQGHALAAALVEEALVRLGFNDGWPLIASSLARRGRELDELKYFSLDLSPDPAARVKVYVRHLESSVAELEEAMAAAPLHRSGDIVEFAQAMGASPEGVLKGRPPATCFAFVEGRGVATATHHFPVNGGYAADDAEVRERVSRYMRNKGLDADVYLRTLGAATTRALDAGIGLQSYASFRRDAAGPRLTVYFPPELYRPGTIASARRREPPSTQQQIVERFEQESITNHPFMRRLRREPVDLCKLWKLMANAQVGIVNGFARRLSQVVAKVSDDRVRSILARQLNDELGGGKFDRAHSELFARLLQGLEPWRPDHVDEKMLSPGRQLSERLEEIYYSPDPFEGVGATMVIEIFGCHVDQFIGDEFRRQKELDPETLQWLSLHETLEEDHSAESLDLAHLAPREALPSLWRGARRVNEASTAFFDQVYGVCFT